jgi:hypothetical protein
MKTSNLPFGTEHAIEVRDSSANDSVKARKLETLDDLLDIFAETLPSGFAMLRTTCVRLSDYFNKPCGQITIDDLDERKDGFRGFLEDRKYRKNAIRSYVNYVNTLLKNASALGWKPSELMPEEWRKVMAKAAGRECADVVKYFSRIRETPRDVTIQDVNDWAKARTIQGLSHEFAMNKKTQFWRLLRDCGSTEQTPMCFVREKDYGITFEQFPPELKKEVLELLRWKCADYSRNRPKDGQHRKVSSMKLQQFICALLGFAMNIRGESGIDSLEQLVREPIIDAFVEWCINERRVKGYTLQSNLGSLCAAMRQHPSSSSIDLSWIRPLVDGIPVEPESELKKRKAEKYLDYEVVESIPAGIHSKRTTPAQIGTDNAALLAMEEFLMRWLPVLPWRQRNIRECRINGATPNLFKGKIPPLSDIDKPSWVRQEQQKNPETTFWQFRFSKDETKTGFPVQALLPRQLVEPLEEYLTWFRPRLIKGTDPGTLFVNQAGNAMNVSQVGRVVSTWTLRLGGTRVTPHIYRDIVAFTWLKEHPQDYLTLSKLLWHRNINTTIKIYGGRYNESSGVVAMETWLEEREAKSK